MLTKEKAICKKPFLIQLTIVFLLFLIFPHCTYLQRPSPKLIYEQCSPQQILQEFINGKDIPTGLKGLAKVKVEAPDEKFSAKEIVIAKRPKHLRLETLNPLGSSVFIIVTDGKKLTLFSPSKNKFYHGLASKRNVALFFHVNLGLQEIVSILFGQVPLIDYDIEQVQTNMGEGFCVLTLSTNNSQYKQIIKVRHHDRLVIKSETYDQSDKLLLSTRYKDYERIKKSIFPREITISLPQDNTKVKIQYKEIVFSPTMEPDLFNLTPPEGTELIPLE